MAVPFDKNGYVQDQRPADLKSFALYALTAACCVLGTMVWMNKDESGACQCDNAAVLSELKSLRSDLTVRRGGAPAGQPAGAPLGAP